MPYVHRTLLRRRTLVFLMVFSSFFMLLTIIISNITNLSDYFNDPMKIAIENRGGRVPYSVFKARSNDYLDPLDPKSYSFIEKEHIKRLLDIFGISTDYAKFFVKENNLTKGQAMDLLNRAEK